MNKLTSKILVDYETVSGDIITKQHLVGVTSNIEAGYETVSGDITATQHLVGNIESTYMPSIKKYTGDYEVTPTPSEQILETKDKRMLDDVTVRAIPYFEVQNQTGGKTVYIG